MDASERIDRLEACEDIRRLIALYAQLLDSHRFDEWGELFTNDAVFRVWQDRYEGRETIQREIGGMQPPGVPGKHVLLQPVIDVHGDRARAWTDMSAMTTADGRVVTATIGRYYDELARDAGRWRFASRTLVMAGEPVPDDLVPSPGA